MTTISDVIEDYRKVFKKKEKEEKEKEKKEGFRFTTSLHR